MKFAIALVAGLASAVKVEDDGSTIDITLVDDGTFEVDDYWSEDEWTDDWDADEFCYDWNWEDCSGMEWRSSCSWEDTPTDCGWWYWDDWSWTEYWVDCDSWNDWCLW